MFWKKRKQQPDPDELVTIASFTERFEADVLKSRLDAEGIQCMVLEENSMKMGLGAPALGMARLKVRRRDADRAADILQL